jgi:hypothetical protein
MLYPSQWLSYSILNHVISPDTVLLKIGGRANTIRPYRRIWILGANGIRPVQHQGTV